LICIKKKSILSNLKSRDKFADYYRLTEPLPAMKKNRKKYSLDKLSSLMDIIETYEQKQFLGGVRVYTTEGYFLGQIGQSNDIRILDNSRDYTSISENDIYSRTSAFCMASGTTRQAIIESVANDLGMTINFTTMSANVMSRYENGQIYVNTAGYLMNRGDNYYDLF